MVERDRSGSWDPPSIEALQRALDQVVEFLRHVEQTPRGRALVIESLRLHDAVGAWRQAPPPGDVRDEVIARILRIASDAEDQAASFKGPPPAGGQVLVKPTVAVAYLQRGAAVAGPPLLGPPAVDLGQTLVVPVEPTSSSGPGFDGERTVRMDSSPEFAAAWDAPDEVGARAGAVQPPPAPARRESAVEVVPPPAMPGEFDAPPSLHLESFVREDLERTRMNVPRSALSLQPISVWSVPRPDGLDPSLVMIGDPYSKQADAYRALRRKLAAGSARTIAVTSAGPREGKTTCAVNLALALAELSPRNVLLVEASLRSPGVAKLLQFDPPRCFTQQITRYQKDPLDAWTVIEQIPPNALRPGRGQPAGKAPALSSRSSVHLLAIDPRVERPRMLDTVAFSMGMEGLKRAGYEYIIIDSPPVIGSLDMSAIGDVVDGVIVTALVKRSTRRALRRAIEQLKPVPVLGVVVME